VTPVEELVARLRKHSQLRFTSSSSSVEIEAPSTDGFPVSLHATSSDYVVHYDGWHEHFASGAAALDCVSFAYSGQCRLAVTYRGSFAVKWVLESRVDGAWRPDSEVGHFLVPFWLRPRVVHRQNPVLLAPA
jgi:hypothetical protein